MTKTSATVEQYADPEADPILPDNIGFHIRILQMRIFREFYRVFEGSGVTPGMHTVLAIIRDNPGMRQRTLAELLMVREPNMTRMIQGLQASGLIAREVDKSDRRAFHLVLTDKGRALMQGVQDRIDGLEAKLLGGLDTQERRNLRSYLDRILDQVE
ncbi:MAG: MarR family winged helix-turn-helix transcriptional regulator [Caulobacteraceae bacterium]